MIDLSLEIISNCRKRDRLKYKNNITLINSFTLQRVKHENEFLNEINYFEEQYKNIKVNVDNQPQLIKYLNQIQQKKIKLPIIIKYVMTKNDITQKQINVKLYIPPQYLYKIKK